MLTGAMDKDAYRTSQQVNMKLRKQGTNNNNNNSSFILQQCDSVLSIKSNLIQSKIQTTTSGGLYTEVYKKILMFNKISFS